MLLQETLLTLEMQVETFIVRKVGCEAKEAIGAHMCALSGSDSRSLPGQSSEPLLYF